MENEFVSSHCTVAKSFTKIFNTFVTDLICIKAEFSEPLNEKMVVEDYPYAERVSFHSLYNFEELHSDIQHLCH